MRADFDREAFGRDIEQWLARNGLSYRNAAIRHPGLNTAMLSRALHHQDLSVVSVLLLCRAASLNPMSYLFVPEGNQAVTAIDNRETFGGTAVRR